jgi:hypothetical protein
VSWRYAEYLIDTKTKSLLEMGWQSAESLRIPEDLSLKKTYS